MIQTKCNPSKLLQINPPKSLQINPPKLLQKNPPKLLQINPPKFLQKNPPIKIRMTIHHESEQRSSILIPSPIIKKIL